MAPSWKQYLKGYVGNSLIVLDAAAILADPALVVEDTLTGTGIQGTRTPAFFPECTCSLQIQIIKLMK